ncbi:hypothetical protein [Puerhibacterium sp. TATVAM-FAB25]|uniref:hypothetical protein n=1 Tax=Puerhibacterium sp. TATVAM-FAB25 TaxID=3093699 RepID=UPI00397D356A
MHAYDDDGRKLDATFSVETVEGSLTVVLESRGGADARGVLRNPDYLDTLDVLLKRLASLKTTLTDAVVDSLSTKALPREERRILPELVRLDLVANLQELRGALTRRAARLGRAPGARGAGNPTKRIRLTVDVPGFTGSEADQRLAEAIAQVPAPSQPVDDYTTHLLRSLTGVELTTTSGANNTILRIDPPHVIVATTRSPEGSPVPIADVARAMHLLNRRGFIVASPENIGYRSAFIGAVLLQLPDARIDATSPPRIVVDQEHADDWVADLPSPGPFQGDLDRPVSIRQRREQRKLREQLLHGRSEAPCALCGDTLPARFLWASHIKRRSAATDGEARDLLAIAMLACIFGCDALFEDGYVAVRDGTVVGTTKVDRSSSLGQHIGNLEGRTVAKYDVSAKYFEWHEEHIFLR